MIKKRVLTDAERAEGALANWARLNEVMSESRNDDREFLMMLLETELENRARKQFVMRIHSRFNRLRAYQEREELLCAIEKAQREHGN